MSQPTDYQDFVDAIYERIRLYNIDMKAVYLPHNQIYCGEEEELGQSKEVYRIVPFSFFRFFIEYHVNDVEIVKNIIQAELKKLDNKDPNINPAIVEYATTLRDLCSRYNIKYDIDDLILVEINLLGRFQTLVYPFMMLNQFFTEEEQKAVNDAFTDQEKRLLMEASEDLKALSAYFAKISASRAATNASTPSTTSSVKSSRPWSSISNSSSSGHMQAAKRKYVFGDTGGFVMRPETPELSPKPQLESPSGPPPAPRKKTTASSRRPGA